MFDFDDVLVNFSEIMYRAIRLNWREFSRYFKDPGDISNQILMARRAYNLNEWLIRPEYVEYTSEQYSALQIKIMAKFVEKIFSKDVYIDAEPTEFAKRTIMNPVYMENDNVSKVYILSRNITKTQNDSKEKFIKKYFNNSKVQYISVNKGERKSDAMKRCGIDFDLFIDDEIPNIRAVAEDFSSLNKKEFLIPKYGYNKMPPELQLLIEEKGGIITYYDPFKK